MSATGRVLGHVGITRGNLRYKTSWNGMISPSESFLYLLLSSVTTVASIVPTDGLIQPGRRLFIYLQDGSSTLTLTHTGISASLNGQISCNNTGSDRDVAAGYVIELMQLPSGLWIETYYRQLL